MNQPSVPTPQKGELKSVRTKKGGCFKDYMLMNFLRRPKEKIKDKCRNLFCLCRLQCSKYKATMSKGSSKIIKILVKSQNMLWYLREAAKCFKTFLSNVTDFHISILGIWNIIIMQYYVPQEDFQISPTSSPNQPDDRSGLQFHYGEDRQQRKEGFFVL